MGEKDVINILDDFDSINELTKFDAMNIGHSRGLYNSNPYPERVYPKVYGRGSKPTYRPDPENVVKVFSSVLCQKSEMCGVSRSENQNPISKGRGIRRQQILERKQKAKTMDANSGAGGLSAIQKDLQETFSNNSSTYAEKIKSNSNSRASTGKKANHQSNSSERDAAIGLKNIGDSLLSPKRKS